LRPMSQNLPFPVPDSSRLLDVTRPAGPDRTMSAFDPLNNAAPMINANVPMGWEYVWHCHLLGHEENDMMRESVFQVPPQTPVAIEAVMGGSGATVTFTDMSLSETGFTLQRADDINFLLNVQTIDSPGAHAGWNTLDAYLDTTAVAGNTYYYRIQAYKPDADYWMPTIGTNGTPSTLPHLVSPWSGVVQTGPSPALTISPATPLSFGNQLVGTSSTAQTITLSNSGPGSLMVANVMFAGANPGNFTQTNSCTNSISPGSSCSISVSFAPMSIGALAANLIFTTTDPANQQPSIPISGIGISPVMVLNPVALAFGNQPVSSTSAAQVLTIDNNTGTAPLTINSIGIAGANPGDFAMTQSCGTLPATLAVGATCTASVTFTPAAAGMRSATLAVAAAVPASSQSAALSGTGTVSGASLAPLSLTFLNQLVNTASAPQTVTLTNSGLAPLSISSIAFAGTNAADYSQTNTCGTSLASGASCPILVTFTPHAPLSPTTRAATLVVTDNAPVPTQSVTLSGTVVAPVASFIPGPVVFPVQVIATTSAPQTLVLSNTGTAPLAINNVSISGANPAEFAFTMGSCTPQLPALASCALTVTFTPAMSGTRNALLAISSSDPVNPVLTVGLTGTGTAVGLSPTAITFPNQTVGTSSTSWTLTIGNSGPTALAINSITLSGGNAADFVLNNQCGASIASGRNCTVRIRFSPTATGLRTASLLVNTSDIGTPQASVALRGTGMAPALSATPGILTFSSPLNTASAAQTVTVSNVGTSSLTITSITLGGTTPGQFTQNNNCTIGTPMNVGASCTINVTFRPTSTNPLAKSQTLNVNVAAPAVSQSIPLNGTVVVPTYTVSPANVAFPNQAINTTSAAQTVTVTNTGTVPLPLTNIAVSGANANRFAQTNTCGAGGFRPFPNNLAVGASCTVSVTFRPTRITRNAASLNISVGGGATPTQTQVPLTGAGQ
jgi:hypothetical protein